MAKYFFEKKATSGLYLWTDDDGGGGANSNWSSTASPTYTATTKPANNDAVTITAATTCTYDEVMTGGSWANGVTLTVNGTLKACETVAAYTLTLNANATVGAAGKINAGTSVAVPYPQTCTFSIVFTGAFGFSTFNTTGQLNLFCTEPTYRYVKLTADKGIGQTVLSVDTSVLADIWAAGNTVNICDINRAQEFETYTIDAGGIAAGTITITPALTKAKSTGAYIVLCTRNIRIAGSTGATTTVINTLTSGHIYCSLTGAGYGLNTCSTANVIVGGVLWNLIRGQYQCSGIANSSAVFTGDTYGHSACAGGTNSNSTYVGCQFGQGSSAGAVNNTCLYAGNIYGQNTCTGVINNTCTFVGNSAGTYSGSGATNNTCAFTNNSYGQYVSFGMSNNLCTFTRNSSGQYIVSGILNNACTFTSNTYNIQRSVSLLNYNCLFTGGVEVYEYTYLYRPSWAYIESIDHNQSLNAYKAWCTGGIVTSQTASPPTGYDIWYELAAEDTTQAQPVFRQYETTVLAGSSIEVVGLIRIADGENLSTAGKTPRLQIIDKFADPLNDPTNDPLDEDAPADCTGATSDWQNVDVIWANAGDGPRQVIVRMIAYTDGLAAVDVDTVWAVAGYQDQIATLYNAIILLKTDVATADTTTSFTLTAGEASPNAYRYNSILVQDVDDGHWEQRKIISWTSGRVITTYLPFTFTPAVGDTAYITALSYGAPVSEVLDKVKRLGPTGQS